MKPIISLIFVLFMLLSCSTIPVATEQTIDDSFSDAAVKAPLVATQISSLADTNTKINPALIAPSSHLKHTYFNISLHDVEAREFFMGLVIDTVENMLVHPDVKGLISLELKNVTVDDVMSAVQKVYGYDYKKNKIGYIVYPATLQTKIFKINRLDLIREGESNTRVSSGQIAGSSDNSAEDDGNNESSSDDGSNSLSSGSWVNTSTKSDFWNEIEIALKSILSVDPQATVVISRHTGVIVVRAKPMQQREIEQYIAITHHQINRQVIIEAKIIEIILDDSHQAGVNWQSVVREAIETAPVLTGVGAIGTSFRNVFTVGATAGDFSAFVEFLETQGKTNILSSPRISTLNNQKAIIKVGSDEYFITDVSSDTITTGTSTIVNPDITFTPFFSGIALDVTPQINDADEITLHIHPSITRVENRIRNFTINGQNNSIPLALNTIRESDSIVKVKSGQIIVIGGLMQEIREENKKGIAGLSQIPYLGNLFRVNSLETQKSELVILLKATIINDQNDWLPALDNSKQNIKQLQSHPLWK